MPHDVIMTAFARAERDALCDLLLEVGPDAPTLCEGWDARDLAAHLVVRERRPDASVGIIVPAMAGWTQKVQDDAARRPFPTLVEQVRSGPPVYSPFRLPGVDEQANLFEYLVHHEDVRRATPGWEPREIDPAMADLLWARLGRSGRLLWGKVPVIVNLRRTDLQPGGPDDGTRGRTHGIVHIPKGVAVGPGPEVSVVGDVVELVMHGFGRSEAHVTVTGSDAAVAAYEGARRGL